MQVETEKDILIRYETLINELFKAEEWLKSKKGYESWEDMRKHGGKNGVNAYNKYKAKEKEVYELQKVLHKHMGIVSYG